MILSPNKIHLDLSYRLGWTVGKVFDGVGSVMEWVEPKKHKRKLLSTTAILVDYAGESTFENFVTRDELSYVSFVCSEKALVGDEVNLLLKKEYQTEKGVELSELSQNGIVSRIQIKSKRSCYVIEICLKTCNMEKELD